MKQYEENGYLVTEYDNGTIIKSLIGETNIIPTNEPNPTNPLTILQKENVELKAKIELLQKAIDDLLLGGN
jgi:hypothetical protein